MKLGFNRTRPRSKHIGKRENVKFQGVPYRLGEAHADQGLGAEGEGEVGEADGTVNMNVCETPTVDGFPVDSLLRRGCDQFFFLDLRTVEFICSTRVNKLESNSSFQGESLAASKLQDYENFVPPRAVLPFRVPAEFRLKKLPGFCVGFSMHFGKDFQFRPSQRL